MKRTWKSRVFAGFLCFVLMFGLLPTGYLSDLMPEVVPDISTEAEAVAGSSSRISGLFYIKVNSNKNLYMTNSNWYTTQSTFEAKASGDDLLSQMWLFIYGNDGYTYIRSLSDVMANQGGTYGNRWLSWDHGWNGTTFPTCKNIDTTVSAEPGNPTGQGTYKWQTTSLTANADGSYTCYIKESAAAYYIQNVGGKVQTGRALGNTDGTLLYLEPVYDPMFESDRPLQLINQPTGNTTYKLNCNTDGSVNMQPGSTNTVNITWAITKANNGYWYLINRSNGQYLAGDQVTVGGTVTTKSVTGNPANDAAIQWQIIRQRYTTFTTYIIINKGTGLILNSNGSKASTYGYDFAHNMYTYWTLGYNIDHGEEVPETPQFYSWASGTYKYYPATFSNQAGYVALRANQAKSVDGDKTGYLFDTVAMTHVSSDSPSLTANSTNHFWYNSAYAGFIEHPSSHNLGTTRIQFSFSQASNQFIWIIGHGTKVSANVNGTTYTVTNGITKITPGTSGTGTVEITATGHFGIFTNVLPVAQSGSVTVTMEGTDNQVIHGDTTYTVRVTNSTNYPIDNVSFTVAISGGHSVTVTVSNGAISSNNTNIATVSGSARSITAGSSATWTITMKPGGMTGGTNYTITANTGTYISFNTSDSMPTASNTIARGTTYSKALQECNGGSVTASVAVVPDGGTVNGDVTYTIKIVNGCNHTVNNINFTFGNGSVTLFKLVNGAVQNKHSACYDPSGYSNSIGANSTMTITVKVNMAHGGGLSTSVGTAYQFAVSGGTASNCAYTTLTFSTGNTTTITTVKGSMSVKLSTNISSAAIVNGNVIYYIEITNGTNHKITNINLALMAGDITLVTVTNGAVTANQSYVSVSGTVGDMNAGAVVTLTVTVNTSELNPGSTYTVKTISGLCEAKDLASGTRSVAVPAADNTYSITIAKGTVTTTLTADGINNNGVGEDTVNYTITLQNNTNYTLKGITFVVKDSAGNALFTVNNDGTITVHNSTLVKNANGSKLTVNGSLTGLTAGSTVTITGIQIDADADALDAAGKLVLTATGSTQSANVEGTALSPSDASDTFTIMVRHDVDLLVQAGVNTPIDRDKIFAAMNKSGAYGPEKSNGLAANTISAITLTDANGNSISNANITINGSNLVIDQTAEYGEYIIKVTYSGGSILVPIQVTTVDAGEDKTFVLDYGLPVSIDMATMLNDLRLTGGSYPSITNAVTGFSAAMSGAGASTLNGTFGNFAFENDAFGYTTSKFMDNEDFAYIVILVGGNGTENVDYVNVYKKVSFIPSNVIYYEDTLVGSITYPGGYTLDALGELASIGDSLIQDLPTTGNMGFDDGSYAGATDVMLSGESVQQVTVNGEQVTVSFTFTGTGFELISRVNAYDAATILVKVSPAGQENWTYYPVITRFDPNGNGSAEVYQVPVFRLNEVAYGSYDVQIVGLPKQEFDETGNVTKTETSFIYIDGIRVYNPLGNSDLTNYYGDEKDAEFTNLRDLILAGQGMVAEYTDDVTSFTSGSYYYVATEDKWFTAAMGSVNELGAIGANNEILIRQNAGNHIVVLKVKETSAGAGLLQIGVHDIHDAKFDGSDGANESTSVSYKTTSGWVSLVSGTYSGTEQYYEIDLSQCPTDGEYKIVILQVDSGFASFTNIKHKNVTFGQTGPGVLDIYTTPGYFFDEEGNMCSKDEAGNKKIEVEAGEMVNITELNGILSGNE